MIVAARVQRSLVGGDDIEESRLLIPAGMFLIIEEWGGGGGCSLGLPTR